MKRTPKEAVARCTGKPIEALIMALRHRGIAADEVDSGPSRSVWVERERAEDARRVVERHGGSVRPVTGAESAYEFCAQCRYDHGPGPTYCPRCGEYVRA